MDDDQEIRVAEMFSGVGGFRLGLERSNLSDTRANQQGQVYPKAKHAKRQRHDTLERDAAHPKSRTTPIGSTNRGSEGQPYRCVWANDHDKYANKIYRKNFGSEELVEANIRDVSATEIPDCDLLTAGFPCQAFSVAGKRKGFEDTRGTLFYDIARIVKAKRPSLLLLENVKGLLSAQKGYCFYRILQTLAELGYLLEWQVLNSKFFGVPQNRERVFLVGHLGAGGGRQIFPLGQDGEVLVGEARGEPEGGQASSTLEASYGKTKSMSNMIQVANLWDTGHAGRVNSPDGISQTMKKSGGYTEPLVAIKKVGNIFPSKHESGDILDPSGIAPTLRPHGNRASRRTANPKILHQNISKNVSVRDEAVALRKGASHNYQTVMEVANTVDADGYLRFGRRPRDKEGNPQLLPIGYRRIRRLTPVECERLQGFPDGWTQGVSDTQRYKLLGNAVTVNVIEFLGRRLRESFNYT